MSKTNAIVFAKDGEVKASSRDVAAAFEKNHRDVLRAIDNMIALAPELRQRNFAQWEFLQEGAAPRPHRFFEMTRDGFSLLARGFTREKALKWKIAFIDAFNRMERALQAPAANDDGAGFGLLDQPGFRNADEREALWLGIAAVRRMQAMKGSKAAAALWAKLGLPEAEGTAALAAPAERATVAQWALACDVRVSLTTDTPRAAAWQHYASWAMAQGMTFSEPPKFAEHLRSYFEIAGKGGNFPIEIGEGTG